MNVLEVSTSPVQDGEVTEKIGAGIESLLGPRDLWSALDNIVNEGSRSIHFNIRNCLENVRLAKEVNTNTGKGRLFIRYLLKRNLLTETLDYLAPHPLLLKFAAKADKMTWEIDLANSCWLDSCWQLPVQETHLFVPTADLGIYVSVVDQKPVVTKVMSGSVAAEDGKVEVGDVITHINSELVINRKSRDGLDKMLNLLGKFKNKPISVTVTKVWNSVNRELFPQIVPLLRSIKINVEDLKRAYFLTRRGVRRKSDEDEEYNPLEDDLDDEVGKEGNGYPCLYIGSVNLGPKCEFAQIETGIRTVLDRTPSGVGHPAVLRLTELEMRLSRSESNDLVMRLTYPNIASCGRILSLPKYFAFISCPAKQDPGYMCHVFYTGGENVAKEILDSLSDGFKRTSFTV